MIIIDEGFINLQYIVNDKGVKIIDLNARFCGSMIHSFGAGVNFPYLALSLHYGDPLPHFTVDWNTSMMRYWEAVFFHEE